MLADPETTLAGLNHALAKNVTVIHADPRQRTSRAERHRLYRATAFTTGTRAILKRDRRGGAARSAPT